MAKQLSVLLGFFILTSQAWGSEADYYAKDLLEILKSSHDEDEIRQAMARHNRRELDPLGYNKMARKILFGEIDLQQDDQGYYVRDVYCGKLIRKSVGPSQMPSASEVNTEHTWPQSLGAKQEPFRGDLHHLYPADSKANSTRGNSPFGEVEGEPVMADCPSKSGRMIDPETGEASGPRAFEPVLDHRGNVARAMFYASVVYNKPIGEMEESYLRKWHLDDPVDLDEKLRNDAIELAQGNRNPFIDHPDLADRISNF